MGARVLAGVCVLLQLVVFCRGQQLLDPIPRECRTLDSLATLTQETQANEYPAGGVLMTLAQVPAGIKGVFEFYLCPDEGNEDQEECLIRVPLQLADGSGSQFRLDGVTRTDKYQIPLLLPDDIICRACTLQWRVVVEDCRDDDDDDNDDDDDDDCQLIDDFFCSTISIREIRMMDKRLFSFLINMVSSLFSRSG